MPKTTAAPSVDSIRLYLNEIARIPMLSLEEEIILGRRVWWMVKVRDLRLAEPDARLSDEQIADRLMQTYPDRLSKIGKVELTHADIRILERMGLAARCRMVASNLRLVVSIAKSWQCAEMPLLDLIQEGTIGLHTGIEKFDTDKGYRLSTYVSWWIKQSIRRAVHDKSRTIRLPVPFQAKLKLIAQAERDSSDDCSTMTVVESLIADGVIKSEQQYSTIKQQAQVALSLNRGGTPNEDVSELIDMLPCPNSLGSTWIENANLQHDIGLVIATLSATEQRVIRLRYGMEGVAMSFAEIAFEIGVSRDEARRIHGHAMSDLRDYRNKRILEPHR